MPNERMPNVGESSKWGEDSIDSWENDTDDPMARDIGERGDRQIDEETRGFDGESRDFTLPEEESDDTNERQSWLDDEVDPMERYDEDDIDSDSRERMNAA